MFSKFKSIKCSAVFKKNICGAPSPPKPRHQTADETLNKFLFFRLIPPTALVVPLCEIICEYINQRLLLRLT